MCRMFCLSGDFSKEYKKILDSFIEVTRNDTLSVNSDGSLTSHDHGYGYVRYDSSSLEFFRSRTPVFESNIQDFRSGQFIMHARKAAPDEPVGTLESHPHYEVDEDYEVFLAHNGWFDKKKIAVELGIENFTRYVDSQLFLKYILSFNGEFRTRLEKAISLAKEKDLIRATANLMILSIDRNTRNSKLYYYTDVKEGSEYSDYVKLYHGNTDLWNGVFSSSIIKSISFPKNVTMKEVRRGVLNEL